LPINSAYSLEGGALFGGQRSFTHGFYPEKDELPYRFTQRYLAARDA